MVIYEEKLNIADMLGQPSVCCLFSTGCPVSRTDSHESEAVLSVTSVARRDAVSDSSRQPPSQQLAFIYTNIQLEAKPPVAAESIERLETAHQCSPDVIDCELAASQAASQSDGSGRVLGIDGSCFDKSNSTAGAVQVKANLHDLSHHQKIQFHQYHGLIQR